MQTYTGKRTILVKKDKTRTYTVYLTVPRLDMEWHIQHMACNSSQISSTINHIEIVGSSFSTVNKEGHAEC